MLQVCNMFVLQVCNMLSSLENYYWRYTSASELVNMILAFVETRAVQVRLSLSLEDCSRGSTYGNVMVVSQ